MKKITGKVCISKWTGSSEGVSVDITDENSGVLIAQLQFTVEDFARCLFGSAYTPCQAMVYDTFEDIGKFPIRKIVWAISNNFNDNRNEIAKAAAKPHEVDGWRYSSHQVGNGHYAIRGVGDTKYPVYLTKYVNTLEEKEEYDTIERLNAKPSGNAAASESRRKSSVGSRKEK